MVETVSLKLPWLDI